MIKEGQCPLLGRCITIYKLYVHKPQFHTVKISSDNTNIYGRITCNTFPFYQCDHSDTMQNCLGCDTGRLIHNVASCLTGSKRWTWTVIINNITLHYSYSELPMYKTAVHN